MKFYSGTSHAWSCSTRKVRVHHVRTRQRSTVRLRGMALLSTEVKHKLLVANKHFSTSSITDQEGLEKGDVLLLSNVWPQPSASAAGLRTMFLLHAFEQDKCWSKVMFGTGASPQQHVGCDRGPELKSVHKEVQSLGVHVLADLPPNDSQRMEAFRTGEGKNISQVIFDRFYNEEAYSFHFWKNNGAKKPALILDMQDMHSLRIGRQEIVKMHDKFDPRHDPFACLDQVMAYTPTASDSTFLREMASIQRSDVALVCSPYEYDLLTTNYQVPQDKVCMASFFLPPRLPQLVDNPKTVSGEPEFVFCGGFRHEPNKDAVEVLLKSVWLSLRQELPTASLHIYGAHCPPHIRERHNPKRQGVHIHGYEPDPQSIFAPGRILLAPLRYGAGIKGKILDAWVHGLPVVTTPIGSEGIVANDNHARFGGMIEFNLDDFCEAALKLALDPSLYQICRVRARKLVEESFVDDLADPDGRWFHLSEKLKEVQQHLDHRRNRDFQQALLWQQSMRSTEYFSRWVELKESLPR